MLQVLALDDDGKVVATTWPAVDVAIRHARRHAPALVVDLPAGAVVFETPMHRVTRAEFGARIHQLVTAVTRVTSTPAEPATAPPRPPYGHRRPPPRRSPQEPAQGAAAPRDRLVRPTAPAAPAAPAVEEPAPVLPTATATPAPEAPTAASEPAAAPPVTATAAPSAPPPTAETSPDPAPAPTAAPRPATLPPPAMPTTPIEEPMVTIPVCIIPGCEASRCASADPDLGKLCSRHRTVAYGRHYRLKAPCAQVVAQMVAEAKGGRAPAKASRASLLEPVEPTPVAQPAPRQAATATLVTTYEDGRKTESRLVSFQVPAGHPVARALALVEQLGGLDLAERRVAQLLALLQGA